MGTPRNAWIGILAVALLALLCTPQTADAFSNPFYARKAITHNNLTPFSKWTSVLARYGEQKTEHDATCRTDSDCEAASWEALLTAQQGKPIAGQLDAVNRFFNEATYKEDRDNFGTDDYWQTPYELLARGGDCEDYAIAKYLSLKRLGIPESSMRIMIVQDQNLGGIMHAILEVTVGSTRYILDNQAQQVIAASKIFHYQPIYAINAMVWWSFV